MDATVDEGKNAQIMSKDKAERRSAERTIADRLMEHQEKDLKFRRRRFWVFTVLLTTIALSYVSMALKIFAPPGSPSEYVSLIRMDGIISADQKLSARKMLPALRKAFEDEDAKGVVISINSPGGSPVQSALIHDRIKELRAEHPDKKLVFVAEDSMTSGAYFIATSAETIYANRSTVTGSIGVISPGWGLDLDKFASKYGVERRVFTAGKFKNRLDMFEPVKKGDRDKMQQMLGNIHAHFIDAVMSTRKDKLKGDPDDIFTGDFWTGNDALEMGLIDGLADLSTVLSRDFGVNDVIDYTPKASIFERFQNGYGITHASDLELMFERLIVGAEHYIQM